MPRQVEGAESSPAFSTPPASPLDEDADAVSNIPEVPLKPDGTFSRVKFSNRVRITSGIRSHPPHPPEHSPTTPTSPTTRPGTRPRAASSVSHRSSVSHNSEPSDSDSDSSSSTASLSVPLRPPSQVTPQQYAAHMTSGSTSIPGTGDPQSGISGLMNAQETNNWLSQLRGPISQKRRRKSNGQENGLNGLLVNAYNEVGPSTPGEGGDRPTAHLVAPDERTPFLKTHSLARYGGNEVERAIALDREVQGQVVELASWSEKLQNPNWWLWQWHKLGNWCCPPEDEEDELEED